MSLVARYPKKAYGFAAKGAILIYNGVSARFVRLPSLVRYGIAALVCGSVIAGAAAAVYRLLPTREERAGRFYERAKAYFDDEKYHEALIECKNAVQLAPRYLKAHYQLALTYIHLGRLHEAAQELYRCVLLNPSDAAVKLKFNAIKQLLSAQQQASDQPSDTPAPAAAAPAAGAVAGDLAMAKTMLYSGDARGALKSAQKVYEDDPAGYEANVLMGDISITLQDVKKARAHYERALEKDKMSGEVYFKLGNTYLYDKEYDKAIELFTQASACMPNNPIIYSILGDCYAYKNDFDNAMAMHKKAYDADPAYLKALKNICNMLVFRGKLTEAEPYIESFVKQAPDDPDALMMRAIFNFRRRRLDAAMKDIGQSIKLRPNHLLTRLIFGRMLAGSGSYEKAAAEFKEAIRINSRVLDPHIELVGTYLKMGELKKAQHEAERALALQPNNYKARLNAARVVTAQRDFGPAIEQLDRIILDFPEKPDAYFYRGVIEHKNKNLEKAVTYYIEALGHDSNYVNAFYALVGIYMKTRNYDKAIRLCNKMLRVHTTNPRIYEVAGKVLATVGKKDSAQAFYEKALDLNSRSVPARLYLMKAYAEKGMEVNALEQAEEILRIQPKNVEALMTSAQIYHSLGKVDQAIARYESALSLQFDHIAANNLAWLYAQSGTRLDRAVELAVRAENESNGLPRIVDTAGWVFMQKGDYDEAIARFRKAVDSEAQNPVYIYHLGLAYFKKGERDRARELLSDALSRSSRFDGADEARRILEEIGKGQ